MRGEPTQGRRQPLDLCGRGLAIGLQQALGLAHGRCHRIPHGVVTLAARGQQQAAERVLELITQEFR